MKIRQDIKRFAIFICFILSASTFVVAQDFNIYQDILSAEVDKLEIANLDSNPIQDAVFNNAQSISIALNIGENFDNVPSTEIYQSVNEIQQFQVIDFNADELDDIIFLEKDYGALILLENDGSGNYIASTLIDTCQVGEFEIIDIDGDNDFDVLGMTQGDDFVSQNLFLYKQNVNTEFEESILFSAEAYFVEDYMLPVDLDKDGDLDILFQPFLSGFSNGFLARGVLFAYTQIQPGVFSSDTLRVTDQAIVDMKVVDMNDDELLDLVFTTKENSTGYDHAFVAFQEEDLNFDFDDISPDQQIFNKDGVPFDLIDINEDGSLDVIFEAKGIHVALNQGNKNFTNRQLVFNDSANDLFSREFQVMDFDNDGLEDILASFNSNGRANNPKKWFWYKMTDRDQLTFENRGEIFQETDGEYSLWTLVDLDQNGYIDVIADRGTPFIFENLNMNVSNIDLTTYNDKITVFPNPVSNIINIQIKGNSLPLEKVVILTLAGQKLYEGRFTNQISIDWLDEGLYILQMSNGNGDIFTRKITKLKSE